MNRSASARQKGIRRKAPNPNKASPKERAKLFTFTIDAATAQVVRFETVDESGTGREISDEETADLAQRGSEKLEQAIEEAFEAGIDCVLGAEDGQNETKESEKDAELRHALLAQLIEHSSVKRLLQRETINRVLLETLIQRSTKSTSGPAAGA